MIVAIHQPNYLPNLAFFYKIANCDKFVFLDNAQYVKHQFMNRNKVKTVNGENWLTVPVLTKDKLGQPIDDVEINNQSNWRIDHWKTIKQNYTKAEHFKEYDFFFEGIYRNNWEWLCHLNKTLIIEICDLLGILKNMNFIYASDMNIDSESTERLINICKAVGGDTYLSGASGHKYLDESLFEKENIKLVYSDFKHPTYNQLWGEFLPNISIIDLLFNEGSKSLDILCQR